MTAPLAARHRDASAPAASTCGCGSTAPDVDLEVTISEVRPDGEETYVQSGWLRASQRALDAAASTALAPGADPRRGRRRAAPDAASSRSCACRSTRSATRSAPARASASSCSRPAATGPSWAFDALTYDAHRSRTASACPARTRRRSCSRWSPASTCPTPLPACGSLRGQPCRDYVATEIGAADHDRARRRCSSSPTTTSSASPRSIPSARPARGSPATTTR